MSAVASLHSQPTEAELFDALVAATADALGARRVLVALPQDASFTIALARLPGRESAAALLRAITPWLDEARRSRRARLRHGPQGAARIEQRSCLVAPLLQARELLAVVYADVEGVHGRFARDDCAALESMAGQVALALTRLRTSADLERQVTAQAALLGQRAGELALIDGIHKGMAARLGFHGIVDLVGDKLREVFGSEDLSIRWWDDQANTMEALYSVEHGQHLPKRPPWPVGAGSPVEKLLRTGVGGYAGTRDEQAAIGIGGAVPGTDWCLSIMAAPIQGTRRVLGSIVLEDHRREHAYGEADLRVLTTIGATLGQALENAKLFDETERLLKEAEARNAELAVVNSVQQGIAGSLDYQGIVELVGEKLRAVFDSGDLGIHVWDEAAQELTDVYAVEHGVRLPARPPRRPVPGSFIHRCVTEPRTFMFGSVEEQAREGVPVQDGTDRARSLLGAPMLAGERLLGYVVVENHERDHAFGDADERLLTTVASSLAMALENARLFDETQRNARESQALSEVGRDLSSTLDLGKVMDRIAGHAKELLQAHNSAIFLPDADGRTYRALVAIGDLSDALKTTVVEPGRGIIGSLIASGRAEFVNDSAADARAVPIPGTPLQPGERLMVVPLKAGEQVQGAMAVWRSGGQPFEARELAFLEGLSQQAVIALNNARLFDQTQAALQRQTASADILRVISQSPTDVMPVVDVIVSTARRLLGCYRTAFLRREGESLRALRTATAGGAAPAMFERIPVDPAQNFPSRVLDSRALLHIPDWLAIELPEHEQTIHRQTGCRSSLMLPLLRGEEAMGVLIFQRDKPEPFSEADIALAQSFADQAVIAIEN
ncbi:MAG TPA: GAF domain-containing protein, partial [Burkholderiaceae bacterium]|nr:GAF domain-containing protein [Burkholderiaceae bacterium]